MKTTDIIYHYCSLDTFINIIQNSTFWLSDILKSNDFQECIWTRDKIKKKIECHLVKENIDYLTAWESGYKMNPTLEDMGVILYTICFSESADALSQWRGYADNGAGIAIGVSKKHLESLNGQLPYGLLFGNVLYSDEEQDEFINRIFEENMITMQEKGIGHAGIELNSNYRLQFPLCKNPSFAEEKEWRLILQTRPENEGIKKEFSGLRFTNAKFRSVNRKLISYLEMDFSLIKRDFIKEVWIGPKANVSKRDMANILSANGFYNLETGYGFENPILIQHSSSSYR